MPRYHVFTIPVLRSYHPSTKFILTRNHVCTIQYHVSTTQYHVCTTPVPCLYHPSTTLILSQYHVHTIPSPCLYYPRTKVILFHYHASTIPVPSLDYPSTTFIPSLYHVHTNSVPRSEDTIQQTRISPNTYTLQRSNGLYSRIVVLIRQVVLETAHPRTVRGTYKSGSPRGQSHWF